MIILDEERSTEKILEYFELLEWWNKGAVLELSSKDIEDDPALVSSKEALLFIEEQILRTNEAIPELEKSITDCINSIAEIEKIILERKEKLLEIQRKILEIVGHIAEIDESLLKIRNGIPSIDESTAWYDQPPLKLSKVLTELSKQICLDSKKVIFYTSQYFSEELFKAVIVTSVTFVIALFFSLQYRLVFYIFIFVTLSIYFLNKLREVYKEYSFKLQQENQQNWRQGNERKLITKRHLLDIQLQELELKQQAFAKEQHESEVSLRELHSKKQKFEINLQSKNQELYNFELSYKHQLDQHGRLTNNLKNKIKDLKYAKLLNLEEKIQIWIDRDLEYLTTFSRKSLGIELSGLKSPGYSGRLNALLDDPIRIFIGINSHRNLQGDILDTDRNNTLELKNNKNNKKLLVNLEHFKIQRGIYGKKRFGVYEFLVIFLCGNFLSYYRCYWDFIEGKPVDEETCEYLYDNIVSIHVQDRSSLNSKKYSRRIYKQFLSLTTTDGKIVSFRIPKDRKESTVSRLPSSQIDDAAAAIRSKWRQKRPGVMKVESVE